MALYSDVLLTVDYDRTLTAPDSSIPERNLEAIRYFIENGGAFTVNTGRSLVMGKAVRDKVPMNAPMLLFNGAVAYDIREDRVEFCREIDLDLWETLRWCEEAFPDLVVEVQSLNAHYITRSNPDWEAFNEYNHCAWAYARPGEDIGPFLKFTLYGTFHDNSVASLFTGTPEELRRMEEAENLMRQRYGDKCEVSRAARIIDLHARGASKGKAARKLKTRLGRKYLVCAGDGENDLSMLYEADYAYVPGDSVLADRFQKVCPCGEGAIAEVIYEKIPEILKKNLTE